MAPSAKAAHDSAGTGESTIGWTLDGGQRGELLQQFPPRYEKVVADHVTLRSRAAESAALPDETLGEIVGRADDGEGVEALVVSIGGTSHRPDGSTYHVTWSLSEGREAKESNAVIRERGFERFDLSMPVKLRPARLR
ncbi:MAG: hypothetical protein JO013_16370 [Alphaproteobacteria bacterium]|nr:hypothetical protein [Alphaproteobacteria bacterium]